ncbi:MAG: hypothetical protein O7E52_13120 [Candidatus Poribacteria bacterium]|nr:hypothetical protein [Candidatus Poribacteria bacterium]
MSHGCPNRDIHGTVSKAILIPHKEKWKVEKLVLSFEVWKVRSDEPFAALKGRLQEAAVLVRESDIPR